MEKKDYGIALILWFIGGVLGGHRVYIKESPFTVFWYWLLVMVTFTGILWYDLFMMKRQIETQQMVDYTKREMLRNNAN